MKKIKFLSVVLILIVGVIFIFIGCQKDEIVSKTENPNEKLKIEIVSFNNFISQEKNKKALNFIEKRLKNNNKDIESDDGSFKISTDNIIMVENENGNSYSFNVINQLEPNHTFENFVVTVYNNGEYEYRIIGFTNKENNKENPAYSIESIVVDSDYIDIEQFFSNKTYLYWEGDCLYMIDSIWMMGWEDGVLIGCDNSGGGDGNSGDGGNSGGDSSETENYEPSDSYLGDNDNYNNNQNGGSGSSSSSSNVPIAVNIPYTTQITNCLGYSPTNLNYKQIKALAIFLDQNDCSPQASEFAEQAIETLNNGGEVDFHNRIIITLPNHPCQEKLISEVLNVNTPLTNLLQTIFNGNNNIYDNNYGITFKIGNVGGSGGITPWSRITKSSDGTFCNLIVNLNEQYINNATNISIARTVLHESVHALLTYMLETGVINLNNPEPEYQQIVLCYFDFLQNTPGSGYDNNFSQHEFMSNLVDMIATSLSNYGNSINCQIPLSYYKKLSWGGLTNDNTGNLYPFFTDAIPIEDDRIEILSIIASEATNTATNGVIPIGNQLNPSEPCN